MLPDSALKKTVQKNPSYETTPGVGTLIMQLATVADDITPWGKVPALRDRQLREFWPTEPFIAGALRTVAMSYSTFSWKVDGPPRTAQTVQDMLHASNLGKGWLNWSFKTIIDLKTQDNGAFTEIIRTGNSENAPVIGINHLDAARCRRTGDLSVPVIYTDREGYEHRMPWYTVITWEDLPSPVETMNGMQYSSVTCALRAAQILRDISVYKREKIGGRGPSSMHMVSGVSQTRIDDQFKLDNERADNSGLARFMMPVVLASLDPNATVSHVEIAMKSLPDGFDEDVVMRWYIAELAMAFGADYQDFAPLPGNGLGQGQQSKVLANKARGRGPATWIKLVEHKFNFHGVLPNSCTFSFDEKDPADELQVEDVREKKYARYSSMKALGIPNEVIYQRMVDEGELTEEELAMLGEADATDDVTVTDNVDYEQPEDVDPVMSGPDIVPNAPVSEGNALMTAAKALLDFFTLRDMRIARKAYKDAQKSEALGAMREAIGVMRVSAKEKSEAPVVNVSVNVPEQKTIITPAPTQPAPIVNVSPPNVIVNLPAEETIELRDASGNLLRTANKKRKR